MIFDVEAIYELFAQVGEPIHLCEITKNAADLNYGIPAQASITKKPIKGYIKPKSVSFLALAGGGENTKTEYTGYIPADELPEVKSTHFIEFNSQYYQIEKVDPIVHQGKTLIYILNLVPKSEKDFLRPTH